MHKLTSSCTILEHEISELRLLVERQTGVVLDCPASAVAARVADFLEEREMDSSAPLFEGLRSPELDPSLLPALLDGLVNTNSGFFRHPGALNTLTKQVLPQIWSRKSADGPGPIRIWSAGCGTGEETYSIAMAVCDAVNPVNVSAPGNSAASSGSKAAARNGGVAETSPAPAIATKPTSGCSIHIVGSDLLPCNIDIADRGVFPQSAVDGLPPASIRNLFFKNRIADARTRSRRRRICG